MVTSRLRNWVVAGAGALALILLAPPAQATVLLPGSTGSASTTSDCPANPPVSPCGAGGLLAFVDYDFAATDGAFTGHLFAGVYINTLGTLDFIYEFTDYSGDAIQRLSAGGPAGGFAGWSTDVMYNNAWYYGNACGSDPICPGSGFVAPSSIDRSGNGNVVGFNFPGGTGVGNHQVTYLLHIRTNATSFGVGNVSIQDGGNWSGFAFAPVPEPASMFLLGTGLVGVSTWARRRRSKS